MTGELSRRSSLFAGTRSTELFYVYGHHLVGLYDEASDNYPPAALQKLLGTYTDEVVPQAAYDEEVYGFLGIPSEAVENPFSVQTIRPDLEIAALDFASLDDHFSRLLAHLDLPSTPLVRLNEARNRVRAPDHGAPPSNRERAAYAALKRAWHIVWALFFQLVSSFPDLPIETA